MLPCWYEFVLVWKTRLIYLLFIRLIMARNVIDLQLDSVSYIAGACNWSTRVTMHISWIQRGILAWSIIFKRATKCCYWFFHAREELKDFGVIFMSVYKGQGRLVRHGGEFQRPPANYTLLSFKTSMFRINAFTWLTVHRRSLL